MLNRFATVGLKNLVKVKKDNIMPCFDHETSINNNNDALQSRIGFLEAAVCAISNAIERDYGNDALVDLINSASDFGKLPGKELHQLVFDHRTADKNRLKAVIATYSKDELHLIQQLIDEGTDYEDKE